MIYSTYQVHRDLMAPARLWAGATATMLEAAEPWTAWARPTTAALRLFEQTGITHRRPEFGFTTVDVDGVPVEVSEAVVDESPFASLIRFDKAGVEGQPRVLLLAPMSGHFATLLRSTVESLLPGHEVYVSDWRNARDVAIAHGKFGFDDYVDHVIRFLDVIGGGAHLFAVCQPCPFAIAAVSLMAEDGHPALPASMTLMAGPVDARVNPTVINEFATTHALEWFERNMISRVPLGSAGAHRPVYPGVVQLSAFMSMNSERHAESHADLHRHMARGEAHKGAHIRAFYDEYFAVSDLDASFFLETVQRVFQDFDLPRGTLEWRGRKVDPTAIRDVALLTIEGENDDICAPGQTQAAHALLSGVPKTLKRHHLQAGAGHYGVVSGRRWREGIFPVLRDFIAAREMAGANRAPKALAS
ncbi:MAG: polyhydroxyalkanoate depolymerase [Caulobacteraceae bacterium]